MLCWSFLLSPGIQFESYSNREGEGKRSLIRPRSKLSFSLDHSWCTSGRRYYDCTKDYGKRDRLTGWLAYRFLMGERVLSMFSKLNGGLTVIHGHAYPSGYFAPFTDVNNRSFFNWSYSHFLLYAIPEFLFLKCLFWFRTQPYKRNWIDWPEPYFCFTARVILKLLTCPLRLNDGIVSPRSTVLRGWEGWPVLSSSDPSFR